MSTSLSHTVAPTWTAKPAADPEHPVRTYVRGVHVLWRREMLHFRRDRAATALALLQPLLFLFCLGPGLAHIAGGSPAGGDYLAFLFPGVLIMAIQPAGITAGMTLIRDREAGFLREMIVAPVPRSALLIGHCLGSTTVATCQTTLLLGAAGFAGLPYNPALLILIAAELALTALAITTLSVALAATLRRPQTLQTVLGVLSMPMFLLSGAMFPLSSLPDWATWPAVANPLAYGVQALRETIDAMSTIDYPESSFLLLGRSILSDMGILAALTVGFLLIASRTFTRAS